MCLGYINNNACRCSLYKLASFPLFTMLVWTFRGLFSEWNESSWDLKCDSALDYSTSWSHVELGIFAPCLWHTCSFLTTPIPARTRKSEGWTRQNSLFLWLNSRSLSRLIFLFFYCYCIVDTKGSTNQKFQLVSTMRQKRRNISLVSI